mgnify:CR=1 FL=1
MFSFLCAVCSVLGLAEGGREVLDQQIIPLCCGMHMWHTLLCSVIVSVHGAGFKGMYSAVYGAVCTVHAMGARCGD